MTLAVSAGARAQTVHLPVTDFVGIQTSIQGWQDPATGNIIYFDAFGRLNTFYHLGLNTQFGGDYSIHDQGDGTQRVILVLHTKDALCWGITTTGGNAPAFGRSTGEVLGGATASVGDGLFRYEFTMPAGGALPQWGTFFGPAADAMATATISCRGELRTNAVTGFVAPQSGFAHTTQTALYDTGADGGTLGCPPEKDANCFPSERVVFKATGRKN
jgi:hypothetical protein